MNNGRLDIPNFQIPLPFDDMDDSVPAADEKTTSEAALAALSVLRVKETTFIDGKDGMKSDEREVVPRWMDLYTRLVEIGWKWRVAVYIAWSAQPKKYRQPPTQEELAIQCLGLTSDRAIATWRKKNQSIDETISMLQGSIIFDGLPDALNAMVEVATDANYKGHQDRKLMFEMAGIYTPSSKITAEMAKKIVNSSPDDLEDMSDEDLRRIGDNITIARESKQQKDEAASDNA